jgi:hypothetical protein
MICVGRKCFAPKVDFPQAAGPHSTTTEGRIKRMILEPL